MSEQRVTGTVKWFNDAKGYGFLAYDGGKDVFVHHSAIVAKGFAAWPRATVEFSIEKGPKGPAAANVREYQCTQCVTCKQQKREGGIIAGPLFFVAPSPVSGKSLLDLGHKLGMFCTLSPS